MTAKELISKLSELEPDVKIIICTMACPGDDVTEVIPCGDIAEIV